jgi:FtsP/CotA-like multicopper oxidase with cupredoxin domain
MTMTTLYWKARAHGVLLALAFILGLSGTSQAAEYWLRAETVAKPMPDGAVITMWGFASCDAAWACGAATVPGPELNVPSGDATGLTVHLRNNLTGPYTESVSIIIPGQQSALAPVMTAPDGQGRQRVTSFVAETPADNSTTIDYVWSGIKPGTYLYQSGTHPALQVQMGLYGAMTHDAAAGQVYGASTAYAAQATLLLSEVDPLVHISVAAGDYGPGMGMTSTMRYEPKYFLINGAASSVGSPISLPTGTAGSRTLLRFLNAGLRMRVPTLNGLFMSLAAEDGNLYPFAKEQYSLMLAPGKTVDAFITPENYGSYAIFDRRMGLANYLQANGGMLAYLSVGTGGPEQVGVFRNGYWYRDTNGNNTWEAGVDATNRLGIAGDVPVVGDWDGNGVDDLGVYRLPYFYRDTNGNGVWDAGVDTVTRFGIPGDIPVVGDWNNDGVSEVGIFRSGTWYLDYNANGVWNAGVDRSFTFGAAGNIPVAGDWNGDGSTNIGVFIPATGVWNLDSNGNGVFDGCGTDTCYTFGQAGDVPALGDWDGNGTTNIGVFRGNGMWYIDSNANGALDAGVDLSFKFGITGDKPVVGKW